MMKDKKTIMYNQADIIHEELHRIEKFLEFDKNPTTAYDPNIAVKKMADLVSLSSDLQKLFGLSSLEDGTTYSKSFPLSHK
ncbi:MAG: hypothetical protein D3916_08960 [Candidatus Electrothrix sp. MAN1_4]|nr:hypothetical protein [Candidatus Electrothrix sp. MAN1_4]